MKIVKKQTSNVVEIETTTKLRMGPGQAQIGKYTNRTKGHGPKPAGKGKSSMETKLLPLPKQYPVQTVHPSGKIRLQLFPLDEFTRMGLEKDGYNPHLELTLSSRKKISSVLNHLICKWGCSSIAIGKPILFPYALSENLSSCRWTLNDRNLTAGEVYEANGSPSIFRLRYGWSSDCNDSLPGLPSTSTLLAACVQSKTMQKDCNSNIVSAYSKGKHTKVTSNEMKPTAVNDATDASVAGKTALSGLAEPTCNEGKMPAGTGQSYLWDDSLTNISIGGLLSEASLQGKLNNGDPKSDGINATLPPSQLISDSLDAFIMSQAQRQPSNISSSSILDAEDTCHAFPFQKFSSSSKDSLVPGATPYSRTCSQDGVSKSLRYPDNISEVNIQSTIPESHGCQQSETDLSLCSRVYNDESSLGLSGIKWTDSLGPFDLGLSSSRKIICGDSLSLSRFIR